MPPKNPFAHIIGQRPPREPAVRLATPDPQEVTAALPVPAEMGQYQAFETGQKPARLVIQCSRGPSHAPAYHLLVNVIFDRRFGGSFVLVFNFMAITVVGRNLAAVVHAISSHRATTITEYDPQAHHVPADDAPVITAIEVQAGEAMSERIEEVAKGKRG